VLRIEDLDFERCKPEFLSAMLEDLKWFGFTWDEGPDLAGEFGPYQQSQRREHYVAAFEKLREKEFVYPCFCSRQDVLRALQAPHIGEEEPVYPGTCRQSSQTETVQPPATKNPISRKANWRFRVQDGEVISFEDGNFGLQRFIAGKDFGDFVVWRHDGQAAYQLAVTVDDSAMRITEVVRGADLLLSTARQLLLYRALGVRPPQFFHCPVVTDTTGTRLAKRNNALSLRALRTRGQTPESIRQTWAGLANREIHLT
jgi:glutamyl-tRNA synthetase